MAQLPDQTGGGGDEEEQQQVESGFSGSQASPARFSAKWDECAALEETPTDITTGDEYGNFDFQVSE